jgi:hypothetical protein
MAANKTGSLNERDTAVECLREFLRCEKRSVKGQSTILDSFNPSFDSRVGLPFQLGFESMHLLADVCRAPHIKAIGNPALTQRGRTCYGPGQTHLPRFASLGGFELVLAKRKRLQSLSNQVACTESGVIAPLLSAAPIFCIHRIPSTKFACGVSTSQW